MPEASPGARSTVLVVEDDEAIRETLTETLRFEGYDVHAASNGADALAWVEGGGAPAMVLLDLIMPGMTGAEVLSRLRARDAAAGLPIVLMTAAFGGGPGVEGAQAVLAKPFDLCDLLALVERFTAR